MSLTPAVPVSLVGLLVLGLGLASSQTVSPSVEDLSNRNADFAARLYRAIAKRTDDNVFLSPLALSTALSALLSSTSGRTRDQLLQGLTLTGLDPQALPDLFQSLRATGNLSNLKQGVAILPSQTYQVSPPYQDLVQTKFGGNIQGLAYAEPQEATSIINRWAQEQTGGKVQQMVTSLSPESQLLLATVAYYQARFTQPFNASSTQDERFYTGNYQVVMVPMMLRTDKYFLAYDRLLKVGVLKLPMSDGTAMLVVLPDEGVDIIDVEDDVNGEKIRAWIRQLKKTKLEVQLPRFLLDRSYTLRDTLQTLDITRVFENDAEIITMGDQGPKLDQVYQKSVVSVDETGDDIGGGAGGFSTLPPRLTINRPFIFIIYHEVTRSVFLMGRVSNPSKE